MFNDFGHYLLLFCFLLSLYGTVASFLAAKFRHRRLYLSAKVAALSTGVLCIMAAFLLWYFFFNRDYSVAYVAKNSSDDLPFMYTISAFWSSLEGSHFLWTLLLTVYCVIAHLTYAKDNEHIMPYVSGCLQGILTWMFYLASTYSDPFSSMFPAPENGNGMNALLQNPYMLFHPPSLFTGYTSLAIPFAYSMAALFYGDITEGWLKTMRRWTLYGWCFLTVGIFLGGRWAYVELGWAGYWAWDPVENSSFMPWLFSTALLHSLLVQDRLGLLKRLSIVLAFLAFFFSFFGTFITRSGVISSVHSFAQSPIGPNYLIFLAALISFALLLYAFKAHSILPADNDKVWGVSKESALVITQFLLLTFAGIVFIGTIYPIVSEAITGVRFNIQAPYFNTFAPYIGFSFALAIGIGNILGYQSGKIKGGKKFLLLTFLLGLPFSLLFAWLGDVFASESFALGMQIIGIVLCFWTLCILTVDIYQRLQHLGFKFQVFFRQSSSYLGSYFAHIGVMCAILGFLGNYRGLDKTATLSTGEHTELMGYTFLFSGVERRYVDNVILYEAVLKVTHGTKELQTIYPARAQYPTSAELYHEVGIKSGFWQDLYCVLSDFDKVDMNKATIEIHINPTVRLVWISVLLMALGGIISLFDRRKGTKNRDNLALAI